MPRLSCVDRMTDPYPSDSIANIAKFDDAVADLPCENILGLVVYDLPGRDCAAKASNGELTYSEIDRYKTEYIDRKGTPTTKASLESSVS